MLGDVVGASDGVVDGGIVVMWKGVSLGEIEGVREGAVDGVSLGVTVGRVDGI